MKSLPTRQRGVTLLVTLVMLLIIMMLSASLASMTLIAEKTARNERDKQVATHAAELALLDAERDIENSTAATSRSHLFASDSSEGFSHRCGAGAATIYQGLCLPSEKEQKQSGIPRTIVGQLQGNDPLSGSVELGRFTGKTMSISDDGGAFPSQLPRYAIELVRDIAYSQPTRTAYMYRITAIGFGIDSATHVVLQSFYRKVSILPKER